jgi:hypothetical protein
MKISEQAVAAAIVAYLEDLGLDVYQEVEIQGTVADIVAVRAPEIWIVETKTTWSLDLLEQLRVHKHDGHAHRLFAGVPTSRNDWDRQRVFKELGFGSIIYFPTWDGHHSKVETVQMAPRLTSHPLPKVLRVLDAGHKTHAKAGAPCAGGRWTPYRRTCEALERIVNRSPGITLVAAVKEIDHHYSTDGAARSSLAHWVMNGKVPGVSLKIDGRSLTLVPAEIEQ